ncbi:MAG: hypothetical protein JXN62_11860 [Bacteroidales bacterium]|nr:hypothetical protein [Bacteroidales bacterium]
MPYRRLPNTDAARIRAMKKALDKGKELPPHKMAYSAKTFVRLQKFLPLFEHNIRLQRLAVASQNKKSKEYNEVSRKARIYLTHFIRVMNMAIYRGDMPPETRAYFGLTTNELTVPDINNDKELITWSQRIIEGEGLRLRSGGSPITNPTIAVVKVRFENFIEEYNSQRILAKKAFDFTERIADMRKEVDDIIRLIWNEVEASLQHLPEEEKRTECEDYGLVYFFRKSELDKSLSGKIIDPVSS